MITNVKDPVWNPNIREWIVDYTIKDGNTEYVQRARCEALVSAERIIKEVKEKVK